MSEPIRPSVGVLRRLVARRLSTRSPWLVRGAFLVGAVFSLLLLYPLCRLLVRTFYVDGHWQLSALADRLSDGHTLRVLGTTLLVVVVAGSIAMLLAATLAWLNERTTARLGLAGEILPIAPLLVPAVAGTVGWTFLLAPRAGLLNVLIRRLLGLLGVSMTDGPFDIFTWYGMLFVYVAYLLPYAYLPIVAALRSMDPSLEEASRLSGQGPLRTFFNVTLPCIKPAVATGAFMVLAVGLGIYSIPAILGSRIGVEVASVSMVRAMKFSYPPEIDEAITIGVVLLALIAVAWRVQSRVARSGNYATVGTRGHRSTAVELGRWRPLARCFMVGYILVMSVLPLVGLVFTSFQPFWTPKIKWSTLTLDNYRMLFEGNAEPARALRNSFTLAVVGATIGVLVAFLLALLVRMTRSRSTSFIDGVVKLPGNLSHIVVAIAFVLAYAGEPFGLGGTRLILLLAYLCIYMPQAVLNTGDALGRVDQALLDASALSRQPFAQSIMRIAFPLMVPGLVVAWSLLFVHIIGDVNASSILVGIRTEVAGSAIVNLYDGGVHTQLAALAVVISAASAFAVVVAMALGRRHARR